MDANEMERAAFPHLSQTCWCGSCDAIAARGLPEGDWRRLMRRMNLCPDCGNKRCPRATHHANACTNSNEAGQDGSAYAVPAAAKYAEFPDEAVGRMTRSLAVGLNEARDTSSYRWPQQEDLPPVVRRILDDLIEGGFVIVPRAVVRPLTASGGTS